MKKVLLIISLLFSTASFSQYIPMLEEGNTWSVDVHYEPFDPPEPPYSWVITEQVSIGSIENFNGIGYFRMKSDDQSTCLLREENGIVYRYDENENTENVLFDFTLEEGDTFNLFGSAYHYYPPCTLMGTDLWETQLTVDIVEDIEIAGKIRKVITFIENNELGQIQWIEGIGNISGFDILWGWLDVTGYSALVCFNTNGVSYFFNEATPCDNTTLSIGETFKEKIILYPNPISEKSILQLPIEAEIDYLKIYNITGKLIKEDVIITENYILNNMNFASGFYFYQVFSNGTLKKTEKFIVK